MKKLFTLLTLIITFTSCDNNPTENSYVEPQQDTTIYPAPQNPIQQDGTAIKHINKLIITDTSTVLSADTTRNSDNQLVYRIQFEHGVTTYTVDSNDNIIFYMDSNDFWATYKYNDSNQIELYTDVNEKIVAFTYTDSSTIETVINEGL